MARVTKKQFAEYEDLLAQKKEADRKSQNIKKKLDALKSAFDMHVRAFGGKERACVTCGYRLVLEEIDGRVTWKKVAIDSIGIDQVTKLQTEAPKGEKLLIEKV